MNVQENYTNIRKIFFWLFSLLFLIGTPTVVFYSVGYKFDRISKKFLKTGTISIKTFPKDAKVFFNDGEREERTPCFLKELFPREYKLSLQKEGFYPYQISVKVNQNLVSDIDAVLVPVMKNVEKIDFDFDVYKFFVTSHILGINIIAFTDKGIYFLDKDFVELKKITNQALDKYTANTIEGMKESSNRVVFWNKNNIWLVKSEIMLDKNSNQISLLYKAEENVGNVFLGLKEHYLIIQDGLKLIALDIENPKVSFSIFELKSIQAVIFYESRSETLYIKDKIPGINSFSLFKIKLIPIVHEKKET